MRSIECATEAARENELNYFERHCGPNKILFEQGSCLFTDNAGNHIEGTVVATSDNNGVVTIVTD